ncbi:MAG: type II toxin-antitoxin system HigB family toxin [Sphingomicrobium sp.]|jgi:mRNA interferase HigB
MRIISVKSLKDHWERPGREDSEQALKAWYAMAKEASWEHFAQLKQQFGSASAVGDRVVFNIGGNKYRLVTYINYEFHTIYVRFVGTHREYDEVDVANV